MGFTLGRVLRPMVGLAVGLALLAGGCSGERVEADILIYMVTLIDGTGARAVPNRAVAIRGDRIVAIGPAGSVMVGAKTVRIDGRGKYLVPGLWDMHVHLMGYGEHAFPLFIANGVTTIREVGGNLAQSLQLRDETRSGRMLGPELLIAGPVLDAPYLVSAVQGTPYADGREPVAESAQAGFWVDSLNRVKVDQIKVHSMTPRTAYFAILARAKAVGIPVVGHLPDSIMPREAIEAGQRTIEHHWRLDLATSSRGEEIARWELAALQAAIESAGRHPRMGPLVMIRMAATDSGLASFDSTRAAEFAAWAAQRDVWFDPTLVVIQAFLGMKEAGQSSALKYVPPAAQLYELALPTDSTPTAADLAKLRQKFLTIRRPIRALIRGGVKIVAGTDVPVMPLVPGFALHRELELLVEAGLTPIQALEAATRNAARAAGRSDQVGTIEIGKRADLVLLDADPLADIANTRRIGAVITRGRLLDRAALDRMLADAETYAKEHPR